MVIRALRGANRRVKLWRAYGLRSRLCKEAAAFTAMCAHIWQAFKADCEWLSDWGLRSERVRITTKLHVTTEVEVATSWRLPSWMVADLDIVVSPGAASDKEDC